MAGTTSPNSIAFCSEFLQSAHTYSYTIMCSIKCSFGLAILLVVISTTNVNANYPIRELQQQQQHVDWTPGFKSTISSPYWEYMLRESVFRTISPPPLANNALYKDLLDAPLYTGPFLTGSRNHETIVQSRGDVYHLPNGRWIFCQEGCINCEPCIRQDTPTVKWILRRIMRLSHYGTGRYDLQLTVLPHLDGSYHMNNLWPQSYIYVSSEGQQLDYEISKTTYEDTKSSLENVNDKLFERQGMSRNFAPFNKGNLDTVDPIVQSRSALETVEQGTTIAVTSNQEHQTKRKQRLRNFRKQNLRSTTTEKSMDPEFSTVLIEVREDGMKESSPQLILGTDQQGHKHLVHVVAAEERSVTRNTTGYGTFNTSGVSPGLDAESKRITKSSSKNNNSDYQRILQKIYYSLSTHQHFIEKFLKSSANLTIRNSKELIPADRQVDKNQETRYRKENLNPVSRYNRNCHSFNITQSSVKEELAVESGRSANFDSAIRSNPKINTNTVPSLVRDKNGNSSAGFKVDFLNNISTNNSNFHQGAEASVFLNTSALNHSPTISTLEKTSTLLQQ